MTAPRDIVLVRDGAWADRVGALLSDRGHRVRQLRPPVRGRTLRRLAELAQAAERAAPEGPSGRGGLVVVMARQASGGAPAARAIPATATASVRRVWRVPPGVRTVALCREPRRPGTRTHRQVLRWGGAADRFLALTAEEADAWARDGLSNATVMPDPLPPPQRSADLTEPVVVATGGPGHEEGIDLLLESWAAVSPRHPSWRLRLTGCAGSADLRRQAVRLGVAATVEFGDPADAAAEGVTGDPLAGASVFALPARTAGYPSGLAAAMARGLPGVAYGGAPGVRELITDGDDGLVVPPGNTREFGAALERLMAAGELRAELGRAARASVRRYAPEAVADRWERLISLLYR